MMLYGEPVLPAIDCFDPVLRWLNGMATSIDAAAHMRLRRSETQAFLARLVKGLRPRIQQVAGALLEAPPALGEQRLAVAFGHGSHFCIGLPLARLAAEIVIGALLAQLRGAWLAVEPSALRWRVGPLARGLQRLALRFEPAHRGVAA